MKKTLGAGLALSLLASACGGGDEAVDSPVDAQVETTLGGAAEPELETTTTVLEVVDEGDIDLYCALWVTSENEGDGFFSSPESDDPSNVEAFIADQTAYLDQGIAAAPEEIKGDLILQRDGIVRIGEILEANGWSLVDSIDEMATDPEVNSAAADEASDRLDAFNEENCEAFALQAEEDAAANETLDESTDDTTDSPDDDIQASEAETLEGLLQTDAGRAAFIGEITAGSDVTEEQAGCLVDNLDADMLVAMNDLDDINSDGAQAFLALLDTCGIPLSAFL